MAIRYNPSLSRLVLSLAQGRSFARASQRVASFTTRPWMGTARSPRVASVLTRDGPASLLWLLSPNNTHPPSSQRSLSTSTSNAQAHVSSLYEEFATKYGRAAQGIVKWMKMFYIDPHGSAKFLPVALEHMAVLPPNEQLLSGLPSLSTAWFLAKAFKVLPAEERVQIFYDLAAKAQAATDHNAAEAPGEQGDKATPDVDGQLDTVLRSFYLINEPEMDAFLESHVTTCLSDLRSSGVFSAPEEKSQLEFNEKIIQSLLPPAAQREREEIWSWPVPAFDPEAFEQSILERDFPLFACTRTTFIDTQRLRVLHEHYPPEYDRALPMVASQITGAVNDSLWSVFFASGHKTCIFRLLDIASISFQRYCDLRAQNPTTSAGTKGSTSSSGTTAPATAADTPAVSAAEPSSPEQQTVQELLSLMQSSAQQDIRAVVQKLPTKNPAAIVGIMAGLSACWSLVENGRAHPSISTILSTTLAQLTGRSLSGSLTNEESRVLNVLQIIVEAIRETTGPTGGCS
jgi:hypothetical protein